MDQVSLVMQLISYREAVMDYLQQHVEPLIRRHGWMIQGVGGGEEELSYAYTIGLSQDGHPEILVFGLAQEVFHPMLNELAGRVVQGGQGLPLRHRIDDVATYPIQLIPIARPYRTHQYAFFNVARRFYRTVIVNAVQLVWPDAMGRFPWEDGFDTRYATPILDMRGLAGYRNPSP